MSKKWEVLSHETLFKRFFRLDEYRIRHQRFDGGEQEIVREVFERGNAVAVLPYDAKRDKVVLIEQFRPGAIRFGAEPWLLEIIAGVIEEGESLEEVAKREAQEEAGCQLTELRQVCRYLVSPGGCSESCTVFIASVDSEGIGGVYGVADEHEDINVHVVPVDQAFQWLREGKICNAVTIIALQWLQLNIEGLRGAEVFE